MGPWTIIGWGQNLTWKLAFRHAMMNRPYACPWWADSKIYALAYLQGTGALMAQGSLDTGPFFHKQPTSS